MSIVYNREAGIVYVEKRNMYQVNTQTAATELDARRRCIVPAIVASTHTNKMAKF